MSREKLFLLLVSIAFLLVSFGMLNADSIPSRAYLPIIVGTRIGQIDYEELKISSLESGAVHSWTVEVASSNFLTITVAPAASANMIISVLDPSGQIIVDKQDQAKAGEVETVANLSAADPGSYRIDIASDPAVQTDYALMVMDSSSFTFDFRGTLTPGIQRAATVPADVDHFWFFAAAEGDTISLQVTPDGSADAYVELYGPDASRLLTVDAELGGIAEILDDFSILASGMYAIRVGEFDFEQMSYQIVMDKVS